MVLSTSIFPFVHKRVLLSFEVSWIGFNLLLWKCNVLCNATSKATKRFLAGDDAELCIINNFNDNLAQIGYYNDDEWVGNMCISYFDKTVRSKVQHYSSQDGLTEMAERLKEEHLGEIKQIKKGGVARNDALVVLKPEVKAANRRKERLNAKLFAASKLDPVDVTDDEDDLPEVTSKDKSRRRVNIKSATRGPVGQPSTPKKE